MKRYTHCVRCGKPKEVPSKAAPKPGSRPRKVSPSSYVDRSVYESDPYCSRDCCEAAHASEVAHPTQAA